LVLDRVLYSVDYPFEDMREAANWFDRAPIAEFDLMNIAGVTCHGYGDGMSLLREPDAANPHVRFDGSMLELVRHPQTKGSATDRLRLNHHATPRLHISTYWPPHLGNRTDRESLCFSALVTHLVG
jgi:hypothetical protein